MEALGLIESIEVAADLTSIDSVAHPNPTAAATYGAMLPIFSSLTTRWSPHDRVAAA